MTVASAGRALLERLASVVHGVHGTRSLAAAGGVVFLLTVTELVLPAGLLPMLTGSAAVLLAVGVLTLPRETAAAQQRVAARLQDPAAERLLARLLVLPVLLLVLLLPRLFLGAYGIPHLTPASGLLLPGLVRRLAVVFLAAVLLVPILGFRQARHGLGPGAVARPRELAPSDLEDDRRRILLGCTLALGAIWLLMLRPFWSPFSLFAWPPAFDSLEGARAVTALAFTLVVPAVLFAGLALDAELVRAAWHLPASPRRRRLLGLGATHLVLLLVALALHAYDLLWVAKYQAASGL